MFWRIGLAGTRNSNSRLARGRIINSLNFEVGNIDDLNRAQNLKLGFCVGLLAYAPSGRGNVDLTSMRNMTSVYVPINSHGRYPARYIQNNGWEVDVRSWINNGHSSRETRWIMRKWEGNLSNGVYLTLQSKQEANWRKVSSWNLGCKLMSSRWGGDSFWHLYDLRES